MNDLKPDRETFEQKYDLYSGFLYRLCVTYLKNHASSEDTVQEAFIKLFFKAPHFETPLNERKWLTKITINLCRDKLRNSWLKRVVPMELPKETCSYPETNEVFMVVQALPEKYRTVILLNCVEGFTIEEIADTLSVGVSAVKMRLKRGKEQLKMDLEEEL